MLLAQCLVACVVVVVGMLVAIGLVRLAADAVIALIAIVGCAIAVYQIQQGVWVGWVSICVHAVGVGGIAALLCLPALPFSHLNQRK